MDRIVGPVEPSIDVTDSKMGQGHLMAQRFVAGILLEEVDVKHLRLLEQLPPEFGHLRNVGARSSRVETRRRQGLVHGVLGQAKILRGAAVLLTRDVGQKPGDQKERTEHGSGPPCLPKLPLSLAVLFGLRTNVFLFAAVE
jgi:hypothetical protein